MSTPIPLTAEYEWDPLGDTVLIAFGDVEVITLPAIRKSRAGDGDDSSFFASEGQAIAAETAASWLRNALAGVSA